MCVKTKKYLFASIINRMINIACIALVLCSTSWAKLWRDPTLDCVPCQQTMVIGCHGAGNSCLVDIINQSSIFHSHLSYAIDVCLVNKIHNFSWCKSKLAFLHSSSSQRLNREWTLNLPYKCLEACKPVLGQWPAWQFPDLCRWLSSKSGNGVNWDLAEVYHCCTWPSSLYESLMHTVSDESNRWVDSFTAEMSAHRGSEFHWAWLILAISSYYQLWIWVVHTPFVAKGFTNIV